MFHRKLLQLPSFSYYFQPEKKEKYELYTIVNMWEKFIQETTNRVSKSDMSAEALLFSRSAYIA